MRRREFITLLGVAAAWPLAARAQQPAMPTIGYLTNGAGLNANNVGAFRKGLSEMGFVEGRNVAVDIRVTEQYDKFPALALELVDRRVAAIFAFSITAAAAAKAATATIPIVFLGAGDPVRVGLVTSLNRPGGNVTGMTSLGVELGPKRLELMRELVPQAAVIGILTNPTGITSLGNMTDVQAAARSVGQEIIILNASSVDEIDAAFTTAAERRFGGLLIDVSGFFIGRRDQIVALAARHAIPANYSSRDFVEVGGLMSYGQDFSESNRQAGVYVGRIVKGERPADLPVLQPAKFEFVINLRTAKALSLTVPPTLLARADEVIE
jgi:putative tryptophan/tyrosine transport system substrate-binding protein